MKYPSECYVTDKLEPSKPERISVGVLSVLFWVALIAVLVAFSCTKPVRDVYYYNAYSPLYDEFFVVKSYSQISNKTTVWFNDNAEVCDYPTPYVATIQSPYNP